MYKNLLLVLFSIPALILIGQLPFSHSQPFPSPDLQDQLEDQWHIHCAEAGIHYVEADVWFHEGWHLMLMSLPQLRAELAFLESPEGAKVQEGYGYFRENEIKNLREAIHFKSTGVPKGVIQHQWQKFRRISLDQ